jgi:exopolysaccharide production protein ExoZ
MPLGDLSEPTTLLTYWSRPIIVLFPVGLALGILERSYRSSITVRWPLGLVMAIFCAFIAAGTVLDLTPDDASILRFVTWIPCTLCVAVCVFAKGNGGRFEYLIQKFGDASYSTYLFHLFVVSALVRTSIIDRSPVLFVILVVVLANFLGLVVFLAIEKPMLRRLRSWLLPRSGSTLRIGEVAAVAAMNPRSS